jgi:hypothetical protein
MNDLSCLEMQILIIVGHYIPLDKVGLGRGKVRRSETFIIPIASCLQALESRALSWRRLGRGSQRPAAWLTAIRHFD